MILQVMSGGSLPDSNPGKGCQIIDKIREVTFRRGIHDEPLLDVCYDVPHRGIMEETISMSGTAYLLNDNGKTVHTFVRNQGAST